MRIGIAILVSWLSLCVFSIQGNAHGADVVDPAELRACITKALGPIENSSREYLKQRECFSCHHQSMSIMALFEARDHGFDVNLENLHAQVNRTVEHLRRGEEPYRRGEGQGGKTDTAGYALLGLARAGWPRDSTTDAVVEYLLQTNQAKGGWTCFSDRPPTQSNDLTTTFVAWNGLAAYQHADVGDRVQARRESLQDWIHKQKVDDNEERAFALLTFSKLELHEEAEKLQALILQHQREDGGWAQTSDRDSDAYATATSLYALSNSGVPASVDSYQRGLRYLVSQQRTDGTWYVKTRSKPIQKYFESGFPHGTDQFVSMSASCWAVVAILQALPKASDAPTWAANLPWKQPGSSVPSPAKEEMPVELSQVEADAFERDIRPILSIKCARCHGEEKQSAELRVDSRPSLLHGGESGPAIKPGDASSSLLIKAVERKEELKMPPDEALSEREVELLRNWITQGARWPKKEQLKTSDARAAASMQHWAFQPLRTPKVPELSKQLSKWSSNPIDQFIARKLEENGQTPSPETSRSNWLRRVYFDLTGLPPTWEQRERFEQDSSPDAYERVVDQLLASSTFGEHWARMWMDVARYSDSKGYVYAREERFFVHAFSFRDWVVDALAQDMPYEDFVRWQLAADQIATDAPESQAAMGFLTLGRRFLGVTPDIVDDRIDVVSRGLLGLTVGCARCHDHKFDPILADDYYGLYGVFNNSIERRVRIDNTGFQATHSTDASNESSESNEYEAELAKREKAYRDRLQSERATAAERVRKKIVDYLAAQLELEKYPIEGFDIIIGPDDIVPAQVRRIEGYLMEAAERSDRIFSIWRLYAAIDSSNFDARIAAVQESVGRLTSAQVNPLVQAVFRTPPKSMREVAERYGSLFSGLQQRATDVSRTETSNTETTSIDRVLAETSLEDEDRRELLRFWTGDASPLEVPDEDIVSTEQFFESKVCEALWKLQGEIDRWILKSQRPVRYATVLVDRQSIREPHVFRRGDPRQLGSRVTRHFPTAIEGMMRGAVSVDTTLSESSADRLPGNSPEPVPFQSGSGRRELAERIVDRSNPLTYRVWVNRVWQNIMGRGLVPTASDFGLRSAPPSHPELLDWMAAEFRDRGQSLKALVREVVLSSTYRQASSASEHVANSVASDPENRLLGRRMTKRLALEQFRDASLQASQSLDHRIGGRAEPFFDESSVRRSLYGLVDRQFLLSSLRVFDFANPDLHIPMRSETTIPQQALFGLNHPYMASLARRCVDSVRRELPPTSRDEQLQRLFRNILGRRADDLEVRQMNGFIEMATEQKTIVRPQSLDWTYGFGEYDPAGKKLKSFQTLPHFSGTAWQGGTKWPDSKLGWVQLTSSGGHTGNDLAHAAVRRWTAGKSGTIRIRSNLKHPSKEGDGVRFSIHSSTNGELGSRELHHAEEQWEIESLEVKQGDTIDFVADVREKLNNDQFEWQIILEFTNGPQRSGLEESSLAGPWNSEQDFAGPTPRMLDPLEQLAQVMLLSNEFLFID